MKIKYETGKIAVTWEFTISLYRQYEGGWSLQISTGRRWHLWDLT